MLSAQLRRLRHSVNERWGIDDQIDVLVKRLAASVRIILDWNEGRIGE
jgi:hypothetical protein